MCVCVPTLSYTSNHHFHSPFHVLIGHVAVMFLSFGVVMFISSNLCAMHTYPYLYFKSCQALDQLHKVYPSKRLYEIHLQSLHSPDYTSKTPVSGLTMHTLTIAGINLLKLFYCDQLCKARDTFRVPKVLYKHTYIHVHI